MPSLQAVFDMQGPLARALPGFRPRPAQQQIAVRIEQALARREALLVEAGTGIGKTYAYLIPALQSGLRVLISTGTRTLQDQLFHRDLPRLAAALGRPARIALLKGRSNYLCRARIPDLGHQAELVPAAANPLHAEVLSWSLHTHTGDWAELAALADGHPLRAQLSSTRERCSGMRCPEYERCHVFAARRRAQEADMVVVNHHLLLADLALKEEGFGDLLPSVDAVILDEAHQLPDLASECFGISLSVRQIEGLLEDLSAQGQRAAQTGASAAAALIRTQAAQVVKTLTLAEQQLRRGAGMEERAQLLSTATPAAMAALRQLETNLTTLAAEVSALAELTPELPDLASCALRARAQAAALTEISRSSVEGVESDEGGEGDGGVEGTRTVTIGPRGFVLRLLPHDISQRFRACMQPGRVAWIFTSATLALGEDFSHFAQRLGLEDAAALTVASPFDYAEQALLYLPAGMPEPTEPGFGEACVEAMLPLIVASGGGAFLLFTSHRALRLAAERLHARLPEELVLLVQGSAPRELLLRHFRACGNAVLLGSASFWEGVDVQGSALRLVVIDRLPFASPEDPLVRARSQYLRAQGRSAFRDYQLPEAVLTLKQGVGRLIRSETDRGVVAICDPRLTARPYGRTFLANLPPMSRTRDLELACARLAQIGAEPARALA